LSQPLIANIQGLKELKEGEEVEVDIEVPPPTWNIEEKDQQDNLQGVNRELGNPPDSSSPEGRVKKEGASQGYESSSEESVEEENNLDESMEEDEDGAEDNIGDVDSPMTPFLGDGLRDCALYLSIRFFLTSSIMAAI
jgi:hypothetical protein